MINNYTKDYLLDKKVTIFQPIDGYRASTDAVLLSAMIDNSVKNASILDVGSGTGAISLCLAQRLKNNNVKIRGIELQNQLCELSNLSAKENNFDFVQFFNIDIREKIKHQELAYCSFDIVITNPPYSDHDMPSPNKSKASAHNHSVSNLTEWLNICLKMLKPYGKLYMVNRVEALPEICCSLQNKAGNLTIIPIHSKENQKAKRIIISAQKDSKSPCNIVHNFITHNHEGNYTDNAQKILREGLSFNDINLF